MVDPDSDETYLPLFEVTVPQGVTEGEGGIDWPAEPGAALPEGIADRRDYTATAGGVVRVPDTASRNRMAEVADGTLVYVTANRNLYLREEGAWTTVAGPAHEERRPKILSGLVTNVVGDEQVGGHYRARVRIEFEPGTFRQAPVILLTGVSNVPGTLVEVSSIERSRNGFTIRTARTNDTPFTVGWMAIERTEETVDASLARTSAAAERDSAE